MSAAPEAPVAPTSHYGCGVESCVPCYGNEVWRRRHDCSECRSRPSDEPWHEGCSGEADGCPCCEMTREESFAEG